MKGNCLFIITGWLAPYEQHWRSDEGGTGANSAQADKEYMTRTFQVLDVTKRVIESNVVEVPKKAAVLLTAYF